MSSGINQQELETKQLDNSVEGLLSRSKELKNALEQFLGKIEQNHAAVTWPTVLDSFALMSSQISSIMSLLRSDKIAPLQNFSVIPLQLSQENDPELEALTEGRLPALTHVVIPDYLRTKPDPDVEKEEKQIFSKSGTVDENTAKNFNRLCDRMLEKIENSSGFKNEQSSFKNIPKTHNPQDTLLLIAATTYGKGLNNFKSPPPDAIQQMSMLSSVPHATLQGKMPGKISNNFSR